MMKTTMKQRVGLFVRIAPDLKRRLGGEAAARDMSVAKLIDRILTAYFEARRNG
jgi:hypothetical protein